MDIQFKELFMAQWKHYFPGADLPLVFFYSDEDVPLEELAEMCGEHCMVCELSGAQQGGTVVFNKTTIRCGGGMRYTGFSPNLRRNFRYFLSSGDDTVEGERYKKTPEMVDELLGQFPPFDAPAKNLICKRWDKIEADENPELVCFLAPPDVLAGLFTLAGYDRTDKDAVITPFGSGCSSLVYHPLHEAKKEYPRAVLGMFDVSARPCVEPGVLSFTVPFARFQEMAENINECFLITDAWKNVRNRILLTQQPPD